MANSQRRRGGRLHQGHCENHAFSRKEAYVRDCFDELFDALERIEHYITTKLILFEDVKFPPEYLVKDLHKRKRHEVVATYIRTYEYDLAARFLERFKEWQAI